MLRLSSDRVEYRIDGGHGILELCSLVVHDLLGPEAANIVEISRSSGCLQRVAASDCGAGRMWRLRLGGNSR